MTTVRQLVGKKLVKGMVILTRAWYTADGVIGRQTHDPSLLRKWG